MRRKSLVRRNLLRRKMMKISGNMIKIKTKMVVRKQSKMLKMMIKKWRKMRMTRWKKMRESSYCAKHASINKIMRASSKTRMTARV